MAGAKKPTSRSKSTAKRPTDAERLAALHAVGLFRELRDVPATKRGDKALAHAIDRLDDGAAYRYRALQSIPDGLGLEAVLAKSGRDRVILRTGAGADVYAPRSHHAWATLLDLGLAEIGDDRRFVAIQGADWEEPLFVLATPAQHQAIVAAGIIAEIDDGFLDPPISLAQQLRTLETDIAKRLPEGIAVRATAEAVELDLDASQVAGLIERLHAVCHHLLASRAFFTMERRR
jgi:hypothetical protein